MAGPLIHALCQFSSPASGCLSSQRSIFGIAMKTGNHLWTFSGRFTRMPIRKTTKSSGIWAVKRPRLTPAPITVIIRRYFRDGQWTRVQAGRTRDGGRSWNRSRDRGDARDRRSRGGGGRPGRRGGAEGGGGGGRIPGRARRHGRPVGGRGGGGGRGGAGDGRGSRQQRGVGRVPSVPGDGRGVL